MLSWFRYAAAQGVLVVVSTLQLSRVSSIVMLVAYIGYIIFQLKTHMQIFEAYQGDEEEEEEEKAVIGYWSGFSWLVGMILIIALISEYAVLLLAAPPHVAREACPGEEIGENHPIELAMYEDQSLSWNRTGSDRNVAEAEIVIFGPAVIFKRLVGAGFNMALIQDRVGYE
ncbi:hypothetical protein V6N11_000971 [Hibiscus sabdariffa]|uniref:Uncharacterized protein n=1 Tax=Hibiscus sabdariffa TaxID=183260 RepID=A0ABR2RYB7_9ROSI